MSKMRNVMVFLGLADEEEEQFDPRYQDPRVAGAPGMGPHTGPQPMRGGPMMGPNGPGSGPMTGPQGPMTGPQGPMSGGIPQPPPRGQMGANNPGYNQYAPNEGSIRTVPPNRDESGGMGGATAVPRPRPGGPRRDGPVRKVESKVHVIEPTEFGDAKEIGDRLKNGQPVVVSVVDTELKLGRRITDFCSACVYMINGKMQRVASNVFLCTPTSADISEGEKKRLQERGLYRL